VAGRLIGQQRDELGGESSKGGRGCAFIPQQAELVGDEGMIGDVYLHALHTT